MQILNIDYVCNSGTGSYYAFLSNHLTELISNRRAIIYTDFVKDVAPLAISLRERGINNWGYHGKQMSGHVKLKAIENWDPENSTVQVCSITEVKITLIYVS